MTWRMVLVGISVKFPEDGVPGFAGAEVEGGFGGEALGGWGAEGAEVGAAVGLGEDGAGG
jgi:hypothetical protein